MKLPVKLVLAIGTKPSGNGATVYWGVEAFIEVANHDNVGNSNELWTFAAPLRRQSDLSLEVRFVLRYQVNGAVYWDNNMERDYVVSKEIRFDRV